MHGTCVIEIPGLRDVVRSINTTLYPDDPLSLDRVLDMDGTPYSMRKLTPRTKLLTNTLLAVLFGIEENIEECVDLEGDELEHLNKCMGDLELEMLYRLFSRGGCLVVKSIQLIDSYGSVKIEF